MADEVGRDFCRSDLNSTLDFKIVSRWDDVEPKWVEAGELLRSSDSITLINVLGLGGDRSLKSMSC